MCLLYLDGLLIKSCISFISTPCTVIISRQSYSLIISFNSTPCTVIISTQSYSLINNHQFQLYPLYSYRISRQTYSLLISSNYTPCTVIISRQSYSHIDKNVVICYKTIYDIFEVLEYKKEKHELISKY